MFRKLGEDIKTRSYAREAQRFARVDKKLMANIQRALNQTNKNSGSAVRSVIENRGTLVIRATSRAAASELYTTKELILKTVRAAGISSVRFTV